MLVLVPGICAVTVPEVFRQYTIFGVSMYLLQIVLHVHYGTTGMVDENIENYTAESLKSLLVKVNRRISESSENVFFNVSLYHIDNLFITQIKDHTFNYENMQIHNRLLNFYCTGMKIDLPEVDND